MASTILKHNGHLSYSICYGFTEGKAHSKNFSKLLEQSGFQQSSNVSKADIIIAHSGGCWQIPVDGSPKLIVYVAPPLSVDKLFKSWAIATWHKVHSSVLVKNIYYALRHPKHNLDLARGAKSLLLVTFPEVPAIFIINRHDPWAKSARLMKYVDDMDWTFISLPGLHDDIWQQPEHYVAIIKHYAGLLAKAN